MMVLNSDQTTHIYGYRQLMVAHVVDELDIGFHAVDIEEMEYALQL